MKTFVIEARYVAIDYIGLVTEWRKVVGFTSRKKALHYGRTVVEKNRFVASWDVISKTQAKESGYDLDTLTTIS